MTPMRIVHIDTEKGWRGGENQLFLLARGLADRGHENLVVAQPDSALAQRARDAGLEVAEIAMGGEWDLIARRRLRAAVRRFNAHLVHAHTAHAHALGLGAVARPGLPPFLVVSRRVDFPVGKTFFSRRKYLAPCARFIAISNGVALALADGGVAADRIRIVHSGVDPHRFSATATGERFRAEMGWGPDCFVVGNVAALVDHKGHVFLLEAARRVLDQAPHARFCVAGQGELRAELERRRDELDLGDRFRFLGQRDDIEECLKGFDLFALSSRLEGLCTSVIDAMWVGAPVVATRTGGVPDLVRHEATGLLVAPCDGAALAEAITRMINAPALRRRLAEQARMEVIERFTADRMVEGILDAYHAILAP